MSAPTTEITRRGFLKVVGTAGAGLTLALFLPERLLRAEEAGSPGAPASSFEPIHPRHELRREPRSQLDHILSHGALGRGTELRIVCKMPLVPLSAALERLHHLLGLLWAQ